MEYYSHVAAYYLRRILTSHIIIFTIIYVIEVIMLLPAPPQNVFEGAFFVQKEMLNFSSENAYKLVS